MEPGNIDIFCDVIDNFGDAGVTYRLAKSLSEELPGAKIRLFTNCLKTFGAIENAIIHTASFQKINGIEYYVYSIITPDFVKEFPPAAFVIEAFACRIPEVYYEKALDSGCVIINLDHLSAEKWIEKVHLKESPTGRKAKKYFFMPGFNERTGGLLLGQRLNTEKIEEKRKYFADLFGLEGDGLTGTIFTYEHDFKYLIGDILESGKKTELIVFGEKSQSCFKKAFGELGVTGVENFYRVKDLTVVFSDFLPQKDYDDLLCTADFNFVRGEDSWARACLSGKPFFWHAYYQKDDYQQVKVNAFNETLKFFFPDERLYSEYSKYMLHLNLRDGDGKDPDFKLFLVNLDAMRSCYESFSDYLFKNCNLIKNLLFFGGSLS
jgi:uncharacterized repeat protein (TIGR03837 family)